MLWCTGCSFTEGLRDGGARPIRPDQILSGGLRLELRNLAQDLRHLAQVVARWARLQPSCFDKKVLGLQQPGRGRFSGYLHVRHGVPPSPSSMSCVDDQAREPELRGRAQAFVLSTQASGANQA